MSRATIWGVQWGYFIELSTEYKVQSTEYYSEYDVGCLEVLGGREDQLRYDA